MIKERNPIIQKNNAKKKSHSIEVSIEAWKRKKMTHIKREKGHHISVNPTEITTKEVDIRRMTVRDRIGTAGISISRISASSAGKLVIGLESAPKEMDLE